MDIDVIVEVREISSHSLLMMRAPKGAKINKHLNRKQENIWMFQVEMPDPESLRELLEVIEKLVENDDKQSLQIEVSSNHSIEAIIKDQESSTGLSGIGISAVKTIVESHGGVFQDNNSNQGKLSYKLSLPLFKDDLNQPREARGI